MTRTETCDNYTTAEFTVNLSSKADDLLLVCQGTEEFYSDFWQLLTADKGKASIQLRFTGLKAGESHWFTVGNKLDFILPPKIDEISYTGGQGKFSYSFFLGITDFKGREAAARSSFYELSDLPENLAEVKSLTFRWPQVQAGWQYTIYASYPGAETVIGRLGQTDKSKFQYAGGDIELFQGKKLQRWQEKTALALPVAEKSSEPLRFNTLSKP